jgi:hypothetical protein
MAALLERLRRARSGVRDAAGLLRSPSPAMLSRCAAMLEGVAASLAEKSAGPAVPDAAALAEARELRAAVASARTLLESAGEYHARWLRRLGTLTAGYTARGGPAPAVRPQRICVSG